MELLIPSAKMKKRQLSIELLKVISIIMVLLFHYSIHGNSETIFSSEFSANQAISYALGSWGLVGVYCFFLSSFWFLLEKKSISVLRIVSLYFEIVETDLAICIACKAFGESVSVMRLFRCLLAPVNCTYWFLTVYLIVYCLSPFLNRLIRNISSKNLVWLTAFSVFFSFILKPISIIFGGGYPAGVLWGGYQYTLLRDV